MLSSCPSEATKRCRRCGKTKLKSEFHRSSKRKDTCQDDCKDCQQKLHQLRRAANPERERVLAAAQYENTKDGKRSKRRLRMYGITEDQYQAKLTEQGGVCAICRKEESTMQNGTLRPLSVDHDHDTLQIRGLLCTSCNQGLGGFADDVSRLLSAVQYLQTYGKA